MSISALDGPIATPLPESDSSNLALASGKISALKAGPGRLSFKTRMLEAREEAIVQAASRLLAEKGYDLMTVDEVAAEVGIAKASLYKHFPSKEALAAAAMARVLMRAQGFLEGLPSSAPPLAQLKAIVRWMMQMQLSGQMPSLPSLNSSLRTALLGDKAYLDGMMVVSDIIGAWIEAAQSQGQINPTLPPLLVLYTLYSRACDPVLEFMRASGLHSDKEIIDMVVMTCFDGLNTR